MKWILILLIAIGLLSCKKEKIEAKRQYSVEANGTSIEVFIDGAKQTGFYPANTWGNPQHIETKLGAKIKVVVTDIQNLTLMIYDGSNALVDEINSTSITTEYTVK